MPIKEEDVIIGAHQLQPNTHTFLYKHALFLAEPGNEIEITTNK